LGGGDLWLNGVVDCGGACWVAGPSAAARQVLRACAQDDGVVVGAKEQATTEAGLSTSVEMTYLLHEKSAVRFANAHLNDDDAVV
jgi:hypothetical protein